MFSIWTLPVLKLLRAERGSFDQNLRKIAAILASILTEFRLCRSNVSKKTRKMVVSSINQVNFMVMNPKDIHKIIH